MLIYHGNKAEFFSKVENDTIAKEIEVLLETKMNRRTTFSEFVSWENSLDYMYKVLLIPNLSATFT